MNAPRVIATLAALCLFAACNAPAEPPPPYLGGWGAPGEFHGASGLTIDAGGNVFVCSPGDNKVLYFDALGTHLGEGGLNSNAFRDVTVLPDGRLIACSTVSASQSALSVFTPSASAFFGATFPTTPRAASSYGCAADASGLIYCTGANAGDVNAFGLDGVRVYNAPSTGVQPAGVAVGPGGDVFVVYSGSAFVKHFSHSLELLATWGGPGSAPGQFSSPFGIAVDGAGNVYVADTGNDRVQKFDANGVLLSLWGTHGTAPGQFNQPVGIDVNAHGDVYVSEFGGNRVQRFGYAVVPATASSWGRVKALFR